MRYVQNEVIILYYILLAYILRDTGQIWYRFDILMHMGANN